MHTNASALPTGELLSLPVRPGTPLVDGVAQYSTPTQLEDSLRLQKAQPAPRAPIERVISGGQTGVDSAGLAAAVILRLPTGGTAPRGYRSEIRSYNEHMVHADFLQKCGLVEDTSWHYPPRTRKNIEDADLTLVFVPPGTTPPGTAGTMALCTQIQAQWCPVRIDDAGAVDRVVTECGRAAWAKGKLITVNIAGPRESRCPGVFFQVIHILLRAWTT